MRQFALHAADAEVHARFAEVDGLKLRVAVRHVQQRDVAEAWQLVQRVLGRSGVSVGPRPQGHAGGAGGAQHLEELARHRELHPEQERLVPLVLPRRLRLRELVQQHRQRRRPVGSNGGLPRAG